MGKIEEFTDIFKKSAEYDELDRKFKLVCNKGIQEVLHYITKFGLNNTEITELQAWKKIAEVTDVDEPKFNPADFYHDMRILFKNADLSEPVRGDKTLYDNGYRIVHKSSLPTQRFNGLDIESLVETVDELRFREFLDYYEPNGELVSEEYRDGFNKACSDVVDILYSLPTQQDKVVVKQYIADWYEEHKHDTLETKFRRAQVDKDERVREWYDNCQGRHANKRANAQEVIAKMDLNGYTIEKEQLYLIKCAEDRSSDDVYLEEALWRTKNRARAESGGTYEAVWNPSKEQCITLNKEKAEHLASLVEGIAVPVEEEE